MLQKLRDKTSGLIAKIVLGALIFVFSFFGIQSYFISRMDTWVAKVGDREITPEALREKINEQRQYMLSMARGQLDGAYFERPEFKRQVLDGLIDQELLKLANEKLGIVIPDQRVRDEILQVPAFQSNGKFDPTMYKAVLAGQGRTTASFERQIREDLEWRALPVEITSTGLATDADIDAYVKLRDQTRDFTYLTLPKPAADDYKPTGAEIEAYYKEHGAEFQTPEQVALEYIELDGAKLKADAAADDASLKDAYEKNKDHYRSNEQRLASHILVKVAKNAAPDVQKAALTKAQDLYKKAKDTKDFAALAKTSTDDLGSKAQGGDLGWLEKGNTDPAFEAALFALKKGEISEPVLSEEGYHIIQLRDLKPEHVRSFDEVKAELAKQAAETERERVFNDAATKLVDTTYEDPTSLVPAAKKLGLEVQKTPLFSRQGGVGIAANPAVLKAAFSDAVLVQGNNSEAIDLAPNHKVVIRVAEHKAVEAKPLEAVRDDVRNRLLAQHFSAQAKTQAEALKARLDKGETLDALATELKLKTAQSKGAGRSAANVDAAIVAAAFKLPHPAPDKPQRTLVPLAGDSYALVQLDAVTPGDVTKIDKAARDQVRDQLARTAANDSARAFIESLRKRTKIQVAEERMQ